MANEFIISNAIPASMKNGNAQSYSPESLIVARVVSVNLKDAESLGTIQFESINTATVISNTAKPVSNNVRLIPYPEEIVMIVRGPSKDINDIRTSTEYYYYPPYSLWTSNHHNKFPSLNKLSAEEQQGIVSSREIGNRLIHLLQPFAGDAIYEGRWGSSIRFGSTDANKTANKWSQTGEQGDPITIIVNGHEAKGVENWTTIVEDIDLDKSSIWMTSTQEVKVKDIIDNFSLESFYGDSKLYGTYNVTKPQEPRRTLSANRQDDITNTA